MQSKASTVSQYLAELPSDRRAAIEALRKVILANLDDDYEEGMQYGMIGYYVPHSVFPPGYHCNPNEPLPFAGIASQKQHLSLYLGGVYCGCVEGDETDEARWFRDAWTRTGKKLDMGKSCVRFRKLDDLSLDAIGDVVRKVSVAKYLETYVATIPEKAWKGSASKAPAAKKATAKKSASAQKAKPTKNRRAEGGPASKA